MRRSAGGMSLALLRMGTLGARIVIVLGAAG
jgi:hypothetical protein